MTNYIKPIGDRLYTLFMQVVFWFVVLIGLPMHVWIAYLLWRQ